MNKTDECHKDNEKGCVGWLMVDDAYQGIYNR